MTDFRADYAAAILSGELDTAFRIAVAHREEFDWTGEYPDTWSDYDIESHRDPANWRNGVWVYPE